MEIDIILLLFLIKLLYTTAKRLVLECSITTFVLITEDVHYYTSIMAELIRASFTVTY